MSTLYQLIADLRLEHPSAEATRTLDLVTAQLGRTQENLWAALAELRKNPLPPGAEPLLEELTARAQIAGVANLMVPLSPREQRERREPLTSGQLGIAVIMGGTALLGIGLVAIAIATTFIH